MNIKKLPEQVINRIAAGEVVDRPFSVVRELVDNALDAGSKSITVSLEGGGRELIEVRDDGCGMSEADALLAFERHATSKISVAEDLEELRTYGFRGEALAAIASVSKITLRTREKKASVGIEVNVLGGAVKKPESVACVKGTTIQIRNIFFNTPARRKFLGSERGEVMKIKQWLRAIALANPKARFELISDQKQKLLLNSRENAIQRAKELYGAGVSFEESRGPVSMKGLLLHPGMAKSSTQALQILVNGRPVIDRMVLRAIKEGFGGALKGKEYPTGFVHITVKPELVDVNIHPQKLEIRFWNSSEMFRILYGIVRDVIQEFKGPKKFGGDRSFTHKEPAPAMQQRSAYEGHVSEGHVSEGHVFEGAAALKTTPLLSDYQPHSESFSESSLQLAESETSYEPATFTYSSLRYLGMVLSCYLLCEQEDSLVIVDMHAAHERINYNKILKKLSTEKIKEDQLLVPIKISFEEEELVELLVSKQEILEESGFRFHESSSKTIEVVGKPSWIPLGKVTVVLKEMAESEALLSSSIEKQRDAVAARLACHASIRSGDSLGREQVYALFEELDKAEFSGACPHGRPITVSFSKPEVEKLFGRIK